MIKMGLFKKSFCFRESDEFEEEEDTSELSNQPKIYITKIVLASTCIPNPCKGLDSVVIVTNIFFFIEQLGKGVKNLNVKKFQKGGVDQKVYIFKKCIFFFFKFFILIKNVTKLKKLYCVKKLKTQIVTKVENSNCDKTQQLKL